MADIVLAPLHLLIDAIVTAIQMLVGFPLAIATVAYEELTNPLEGV